jgi:hypothetical protein
MNDPDYQYILAERLAIDAGGNEPTEAQRLTAQEHARNYVKNRDAMLREQEFGF